MACLSVASPAIISNCSSRCWPVDTKPSKILFAPIRAHHGHHHARFNSSSVALRRRINSRCQKWRRRCSSDATSGEEVYLADLQVPRAWVSPDIAAQEAEWLRGALHQWLDDEYCPEPANEEISRRCAKVYYYCLLEEQLDVGDILMQMVRDLETFSFKQSFHGAFSSANAALELITKRMRGKEASSD